MHFVPPEPVAPLQSRFDTQTVQCVVASARRYQVPALLLEAILVQENGRLGQAVRNKNRTYDLGPAQINTRWLPVFAHSGVKAEHLMNDLCTNLYAAGYVLRDAVNHFGGNDWFRATMAYNVGPKGLKSPGLYRTGYTYAYNVVRVWWQLQHEVFGTEIQHPGRYTVETTDIN